MAASTMLRSAATPTASSIEASSSPSDRLSKVVILYYFTESISINFDEFLFFSIRLLLFLDFVDFFFGSVLLFF